MESGLSIKSLTIQFKTPLLIFALMANEKTTGIILAGGKSQRMGEDKGLLPYRGKLMVEHVIAQLAKVVDEIIIISNNAEYNQFGYLVFEDLIKEKGPVGGIYTGLTNSSTETNVIVSCDTPHVSHQLLNQLLTCQGNYDVTVPSHNARVHPLIGIYQKKCASIFKSAIDQDQLKLMSVNEQTHLNIVTIDRNLEFYDVNLFKNINTPEDLNADND